MLPWLSFLTVALVWGSTYFAIAVSLGSFTAYGLVAVRFAIGAGIALVIARFRKEKWPRATDFGHLVLVGVLLLGIANAFVGVAEIYMASGLVAVFVALMPVWLALFSARREPLGKRGWLGLILGVLGVATLVWPSGPLRFHAGALVAIVIAPMVWAYGTLHGRYYVKSSSLMTNVAIEMGAAAVVGLIIAPMTGGFLHAPLTLNATLGVLYLAFFGSLLAYSAFVYLSKVWPPAKMGTYAFLNPLVAVLLGYFFLGEVFEMRDFIGMAIILVGVAIVQLRLGSSSSKHK